MTNVAFSFRSKDRLDYTRESIQSILASPGEFDLIWVDGSDSDAVPSLACNLQIAHPRIISVDLNIRSGADHAVKHCLKQLLEFSRYEWIGLIENDVVLHPGWFDALTNTIKLAEADGLDVGSASVRGYQSRVLEYRKGYSIDWAIGAGMTLFSRRAAQLILDNYSSTAMSMRSIYTFYAERFHRYVRCSEWREYDLNSTPTHDWGYAPLLYSHDLYSIGAIPSLAHDLQFNVREFLGTDYVDVKMDGLGQVFPPA